MSTKRFYWLKLKEDFFDDDAIEWLEEQKNGKEYALFYLKLCLKALKTDGLLMRKVGNMLLPYDANKLGEITRTPPDTVMVAMDLLTKIGYIEVMDGGALYMTQLAGMVGSETQDAVRMRKKRAQQALESAQIFDQRTLSEQCSDNVRTNVRAEYRDRERDRDRDIEIDSEIERDAEQAAPAPLPPSQSESEISGKKKSIKPEKPVKHKHGEYSNVLLTDEELEKLRELFPHDLQARIERLSEYIASTGKSYKSHFATIRSWAKKDAERAAPAIAAGSAQQVDPFMRNAINRRLTRPHEAATVARWDAEKDAPKKTTANDEELRARAQALQDKLQKEGTP